LEAEKNISAIWWFKKNKEDAEAISPLITEAKLRIVQGKFDKAESILREALRLTQTVQHIFNTFLINVELSRVYHFQGKEDKALSALTKAIEISHAKGYDYLLSRELQKEEWMLQMIRRENIEKPYIISIIRKSELDIHWVDASFFGRPKVLIDDSAIADRSWKTIKAKKLLFFLLLHKHEAVSNDSLIEVFWPDSSLSTGRYNLRKTVQYIRHALKNVLDGKDLIASSKGEYQISSKVSVWLDIDAFEGLVKRARQVKKEDRQHEYYLHKALALYRDGFAHDWYDSWVEEKRRYYQSLYEESLAMMSDFYFRKKKFKEALFYGQRLLSQNFLNEEYHRRLMRTNAKLGLYREIRHDFERLKASLKKELGAEPQRETVSLYRRLMRASRVT
jgi:DNA-binding SARP family transcriptional activator